METFEPTSAPYSTSVMDTSSHIRRLTSGNDSPKFDSGYATANSTASNTPKDLEKLHADSSQWSSGALGHCTSGIRGNPIPFKLSGHGIPKISHKLPDDATTLRFKFVTEQVELPLFKYIQKSKLKRQPNLQLSIRLVMLEGISAEDIRPGIVVLCRENLANRVRRYFDKPEPKGLCRPADLELPRFDVVVIGKAPQLTVAHGDLQIFAQLEHQGSPTATLCGTPVKVSNGTHTRVTTMGGVIMVRYADGRHELYGMIPGHAVKELQTHNYRSSPTKAFSETYGSQNEDQMHSDSDGDMSDYFSSEDEQEQNHRAKAGGVRRSNPFMGNGAAPILNPSPLLEPPLDPLLGWESLGRVTNVADYRPNTGYYDWSLASVDQEKILRNFLYDVEQKRKFPTGDLKLPTKPLAHPKTYSVVMASGLHGLRHGTMSTIPTRFLSVPGQSFVDVYSLRLNGDGEIHEGESGSWIVDQKTLEVYGHLVASDALGYGYVMPLSETFKDILLQVGAVSVEIPSAIDIFCSHQQVMCPRTIFNL
ncbi:hypothetical protein DL98DRAFT_522917 [Cadophora sp. DSE1049]|nr:hypothetical protein DL98DRAFT_522917 [Cadophora sp. DSE1049]